MIVTGSWRGACCSGQLLLVVALFALCLAILASAERTPRAVALAGTPVLVPVRRRVRVPLNYSLYLEHSSEALRDGYSVSGSAQVSGLGEEGGGTVGPDLDSFSSCPSSLLPTTESTPESTLFDCNETDVASDFGVPGETSGASLAALYKLRAGHSFGAVPMAARGHHRHPLRAQAKKQQALARDESSDLLDSSSIGSVLDGQPDEAPLSLESSETAPEATKANSHGTEGCRSAIPMEDLSSDERMERLVSLLQVGSETPHHRSPLAAPLVPHDDAHHTPVHASMPTAVCCGDRSGNHTGDSIQPTGQACGGETHSPRGAQTNTTSFPQSCNAQGCATASSNGGNGARDREAESDWSNEVMLRHASGDRLQLYTDLANIPLESTTPEPDDEHVASDNNDIDDDNDDSHSQISGNARRTPDHSLRHGKKNDGPKEHLHVSHLHASIQDRARYFMDTPASDENSNLDLSDPYH